MLDLGSCWEELQGRVRKARATLLDNQSKCACDVVVQTSTPKWVLSKCLWLYRKPPLILWRNLMRLSEHSNSCLPVELLGHGDHRLFIACRVSESAASPA